MKTVKNKRMATQRLPELEKVQQYQCFQSDNPGHQHQKRAVFQLSSSVFICAEKPRNAALSRASVILVVFLKSNKHG